MNFSFRFDPIELPPEAKELRQEVRAFLRQEVEAGTFVPGDGKGSFSREFSRRVGARGRLYALDDGQQHGNRGGAVQIAAL